MKVLTDDDTTTTEATTTASHILSPGPFGSGELKIELD